MKKNFLFLLFLLPSFLCFSQSDFYAALEMAREKPKLTKEIRTILENMNKPGSSPKQGIDTSGQAMLQNVLRFLEQPFNDYIRPFDFEQVKKAIREMKAKSQPRSTGSRSLQIESYKTAPSSPVDNVTKNATGALSLIGMGADLPTKLLEASTDFLVDRTKQELALTFFTKFRDSLATNKELTILLPNTWALLSSLDEFQVPSMGKLWVQSFEADLRLLPLNLEAYVRSKPQKFEKLLNSEAFKTYLCVLTWMKYQELGMHPASLIQLLADKYRNDVKSSVLAKSLCRLNFISNSLRDTSAKRTWIDPKKLAGLNPTEMQYFTALLFVNHRSEWENLFFKPEPGNYARLYTPMLALASILNNCSKSLEAVQKDRDTLKTQLYAAYRNHFFAMLEWGFSASLVADESSKDNTLNDYFNVYKPIAENTLQALVAFTENNYSLGFVNVLQVMNTISKTDTLMSENTFKGFVKYCNFMVDIATADSTASLKEILQKYALPVASYKIKRKSNFSCELGAYPGVYSGLELITNGWKCSFTYGITAPIGFTFSWSNFPRKCNKRHQPRSFSVFFSVVDIGAAFSYRLANDTAKGFPEQIKWQQLISPGLHLAWGFKNTPLTLMLGGQYTPLLRKIEDKKNILRESNSLMFVATLSVDIPIFNLYSRRP